MNSEDFRIVVRECRLRRRHAVASMFVALLSSVLWLPQISAVAAADSSHTDWNWAGFVASETSHSTIRGSFGTWRVPAVSCTSDRTVSLTWVGIGGYNETEVRGHKETDTLYQTGTGSVCVNDHAQYFAFIDHVGEPIFFDLIAYSPEWVVLGCHGSVRCGTAISVEPNDTLSASVVDQGLYTRWSISDLRGHKALWSHSNLWVTHSHRLSAECIEEGPSHYQLANFSTVVFSRCQASDKTGALHSIVSSPLPQGWSYAQYEISRNGQIDAYPSTANSVTFGAPTGSSTSTSSSPSCIDAANATTLFLASGVSGIQGTESVEEISCTGVWAQGTIVNNSNGVGLVAYEYANGAWHYAASSAFYSTYCSQLSQLGAPQSLLSGCPAGSTTPTTSGTATTTTTSSPPSSAACDDSLLAAAASTWETQNGDPDGSGSAMQYYACDDGFAGVVYTPGNDPGTGATMTFQSENGAWSVLGTANQLSQSSQMPTAVFQQLSSELSSYSSPNTAQTF